MKKRLLPITILASLGVAALAGCGGGSGGGGGGGSTVDVTGVTLNKTSLELYPEGSEKLVATVAPADATDKSVTWKSGDSRICTVDAEGLVTAVAVGTAKVTVTTVDGGYKAECNVTVKLNMNSITISNKTEFADGMEVGTNKAVSVTGDPTINATDLANKGLLTIESSNKAVATTNKLMVYAVGAGTTTITATLFGKTDSFELTVAEKQTNKDKFGTDHEGDATDPFTNEDALKAAKWLKANGGYGTDKYYIKGEVDYFYHNPGERTDKYVSYFLKPATAGGEQFEVYKTLKSDGSALKDSDIWVGGIATAFGAFAEYNGQIETSAATFVSCEGTAPAPRAAVAKTFAEALALGKGLRDGESTYDMPQFEAYVTEKSDSDFFLTATKGEAISDKKANTIQLYNVPETLAATLLKNAKVKVTNSLKNYHGQVETLFAVTADNVSVLEAGEPWVEPEPEKITVAQALEKINAIDISGVTKNSTLYVKDQAGAELKFEVTGYVVGKGSTWTEESQYKNADFYIADTATEETAKLQVYRYADKAIFDALVVGETKVSVTCKLAAYVRVNDGVPSISARETNANPTAVIVSDGGGEGGGGEEGGDTPLASAVTLDFSSVEKGSNVLGDATLSTIKAAAGSSSALVTAASSVSVYPGNGNGGAYANQGGFLKFGTGSVNGELSITFDGLVNKIEISCHDWYKKTADHPTNSNTVAVNGGTAELAPYNEAGTPEVMTFILETASNTINIVSAKRIFVFSIVVSYVEAN